MPIEPGTPLPWRSYECPCGDPLCNQHTISGQRSVGFEPDDAAYIVAACNAYPELLAAVREAREALTPSGDTKAAYHGEFSFIIKQSQEDEDGEAIEVDQRVYVPWTTVKEIMAAILDRSGLDMPGRFV